jgi:outer membrane protein assembly factor BamB
VYKSVKGWWAGKTKRNDNKLYAITPAGQVKWTVTTGDMVTISPAIAADGTVYVGSYDHKLYAITPAGQVKWTVATGDEVDSSPAIVD